MKLSFFDEKAGIVRCSTPWGSWSQTVYDVTVEIELPKGTKGRDVTVTLLSRNICCKNAGNVILQGILFGPVKENEIIWTIEDTKILRVVLTKAEASVKESVWTSLLEDNFEIPKNIQFQVKEKLDLERFQAQNPEYNFVNWKSTSYNYPISLSFDQLENRTNL
ncbi:nudC domain-containing protein 2-like [Artemia franciscana]|uniref:CS domain-containing protein n=1 Tax=Artemia franciscana TaxID=6661 RepID=A0AA88ICP0_ARTSF|nr:hypothetical protein QYM36_000558 [Artemia franciscana]